MNERRTCPECNYVIVNNRCTNYHCNYRGLGWNSEQRAYAWATHPGVIERTDGSYYPDTDNERTNP